MVLSSTSQLMDHRILPVHKLFPLSNYMCTEHNFLFIGFTTKITLFLHFTHAHVCAYAYMHALMCTLTYEADSTILEGKMVVRRLVLVYNMAFKPQLRLSIPYVYKFLP